MSIKGLLKYGLLQKESVYGENGSYETNIYRVFETTPITSKGGLMLNKSSLKTLREDFKFSGFSGFSSLNSTQTPDIVFDLILPFLTGAEVKVFMYIIRRTFGLKSLKMIFH